MAIERKHLQTAAAAAVAVGLLLRLWFVHHAPAVSGDSLVYGGIAKNWMTRGVYGFYDDGAGGISPTLIRLPGYPMFLAACFRLFGMEQYAAVRYVQVVGDLLTCCLAAAVSSRVFGRRAGLATLWLATLCPFTANYAAAPLTETLVLLTIAVVFYGFVRWRDAGAGWNGWLWAVGGALAYSLLLRPDQGLLAAAVLPAMWAAAARREGWRKAATPVIACAVCVALSLAPWTVRNWRTFHTLELLAPRYANDPGEVPPLGFARWYRTWGVEFASTDDVYWKYNGDRITPESLPARAYDGSSPQATEALRRQTISLLDQYNVTAVQTPESEAGFAALASERIHAHPVQYYVLFPMLRVADMILRPRTEIMDVPVEWWRYRDYKAKTLFAAGYGVINLAYMILGLLGFVRWKRDGFAGWPEMAWGLAGTVLLRCALLLTIDNSEPRYTLEFFPVVFVCAGALFGIEKTRTSASSPVETEAAHTE